MLRLLCELDWAEIFKIAVSIWMATVATLALKTWKRQSKAQKQSDFMDELTNSVHEFIASMAAPTEMVKYIKIGIESYDGAPSPDPNLKHSAAIAYIQQNGQEDSKKLFEYLNLCNTSLIKLQALTAKGQVLGLQNYTECQNAVRMMTWQYDRIQALGVMIGRPHLNLQNTEIQQTLEKVIKLDADTIKKDIDTNSVLFLSFVKDNYEKIYK
jgi:hypothetical protein